MNLPILLLVEMCVVSNFTLLRTMRNYCSSHTITGNIFRDGTIGLLGICIFNIRSYQNPLLSDYRNLYSYQHCIRIPTSTSCQHLVLSDILIFVSLIYSINLHFPNFQCQIAPFCRPIFHSEKTFTYTYTLSFLAWVVFIEIWEYLC